MNVSVVIPVYNAIRFVEKAVLSVLSQDEVIEVLVIDDGSTDGSYELLQELEKEHHKDKLFIHPEHINKGRSATRNLGIKNSSGNLIAFLDSDDFFLENRFLKDIDIFNKNPEADGVYNAVGFFNYLNSEGFLNNTYPLYTVRQEVEPTLLFENLVQGKVGHFHINGLTVKRSLFKKTGLFIESLEVMEDSDIFWKMTLVGRLKTGVINRPVAIRGVHDTNIFNNQTIYKKYFYPFYESLITWCSRNKIPLHQIDILFKMLWLVRYKEKHSLSNHILYWLQLTTLHRRLFFSYISIKYFPIVRLRKKLFPLIYSN